MNNLITVRIDADDPYEVDADAVARVIEEEQGNVVAFVRVNGIYLYEYDGAPDE